MGSWAVKYMGSKRMMLQNGLDAVLATEAKSASRIVDLFCGSGAVSWFGAVELGKPVLACDLQRFATTLAGAVVRRTRPVSTESVERQWLAPAARSRQCSNAWGDAEEINDSTLSTEDMHRRAQELCSRPVSEDTQLIWNHYGGHYFSPTQALSFDAMLRTLPAEPLLRNLCLAATIIAASQCAAAPGHTAQPFKATRTAGKYLRDAWTRDPVERARQVVGEISRRHAKYPGETKAIDANAIAPTLGPGDLVFVDPPYSSVQYSRFYHVLETMARGTCGGVEGVGRYPPYAERPNSRYSKKGTSARAIEELLDALSERGCTVVLTFPEGACSNGLSGTGIEWIARKFFHVSRRSITSRFSTLGGNSVNRDARREARELILVLKSKCSDGTEA